MRSIYVLTAAVAAAAIMATPAVARGFTSQSSRTTEAVQVSHLRQAVAWHRSKTWHWQDMAGVRRTPTNYAERHTRSLAFLHWIERTWSARRIAARHLAARHPAIAHYALWMCIHGQEAGDWHNEDTGGNGHYGGLQMTKPWGKGVYYVADAAALTPYEQMRKAELGFVASGYSTTWLLGQWDHPDCLRYA